MKISNRDWIQLSAYLDDELNQKEIELLRRRIETDPALQAALEEINLTRTVLRKTPQIQVPRNFTLQQEQVGIKEKRPVYKGYRLAAVLMSFLLIGVMVIDFGRFFVGGAMAPAMAPVAEEMMLEKAVEIAPEEEDQPVMMAAEEMPESDRSVADEMAFEGEASQPAEEKEGVVEEEMEPMAEEAEESVTPTPEPTQMTGLTSPGVAETEEGETATNDVGKGEDSETLLQNEGQPAATQVTRYADDNQVWEPVRRQISIFRILEIILTIGVLGLGVTSWVLRKRGKKE
jgi:hypothetical protein